MWQSEVDKFIAAAWEFKKSVEFRKYLKEQWVISQIENKVKGSQYDFRRDDFRLPMLDFCGRIKGGG